MENRFCFAGEQYDSISQQYYLRARFYNPVIGRFTQEDTYRGDGLNLYAYCQNNPVYFVDPSGHSLICAKLASEIIDKINQRKASDSETKKLNDYLNEKIANNESLSPEEQAIAQKLGVGNPETAHLYRKMCKAEADDTVALTQLQHAISGAEPTKWLTQSKEKAFQFNNLLNEDKDVIVVDFEIKQKYMDFLNENSVKQRGSKNNPNNKFHYEGLPKPGSHKNFGILDANIEEFNKNIVNVSIINSNTERD